VPATLIRLDAGGQSAAACVPVSYQLARALRYLGFEASLLVVCASVFSKSDAGVRLTDVGVWSHEPHWHGPDGSLFDGHVVVYSRSFQRLVDVTIGQDSTLYRASGKDPEITRPLILPLPALNIVPTTLRSGFMISYNLFPGWTQTLDPYWQDIDRMAALERGALSLAHETLKVLRAFEEEFPGSCVPPGPVRELLDGDARLPEFVLDLATWRERASSDMAIWSQSVSADPRGHRAAGGSMLAWLRQRWHRLGHRSPQ
jgi:hypothetical protein